MSARGGNGSGEENNEYSNSCEFSAQLDAFTDPDKKHMTMSHQRSESEKSMRKTHTMIRNKRKKDASDRATEKRHKCGNRKKQNVVVDMVSSVVPVETEHLNMVSTLEEPVLSIYMKNYHEFLVRQAEGMNHASFLDEKEQEERRIEKEQKEKRRILRKHKIAMQPTLNLVSSSHTYTPEKPLNTVSGNGTLNGYFTGSSNRHTNSAERFWRRIYHENVKISTSIIQNWPVYRDNKESSQRTLSSKVQQIKDMKCEQCNIHFMVDMRHGNMSCPSCGIVTTGGEGIGYQVTFSHQQATQKAAAPYERLAHVSLLYLPLLGLVATGGFGPYRGVKPWWGVD